MLNSNNLFERGLSQKLPGNSFKWVENLEGSNEKPFVKVTLQDDKINLVNQ